MAKRDQRVDDYIAKAPAFAQPVLHEIRKRLHEAVSTLEEDIKWNVPFFLNDGKILASMAAFKKHTKFGLWGAGTRPRFVDVIAVDGLAAMNDFTQRVKDAAAQISSGNFNMRGLVDKMTKPSKKAATKPAAKKAAPKKAAPKKAAAKKKSVAKTKAAPKKKAAAKKKR